MKNILKLFLIGFLFQLTHGKNLKIISSNALSNFELLDVHISGNHAFIPGGLGGLNIVDISQPNTVSVVGEYFASGCDYGRIYSWITHGNYAYGNGRECGVHIVDISDISNPSFVNIYGAENRRYEHASVLGNTLFFATHQMGVDIVSAENPNTLTSIAIIPTHNAWATYPENDFLYIADGTSGLIVVDISDLASPTIISETPTSGSAKDLLKKGNFLFMAVGADGVDMFDVSNPESPQFISNYNTSGFATRVDGNDSLIVVSDWDDVEVLGYSTGELLLKGYKDTGGRVMAVAMENDIIFSAEWAQFRRLKYQDILTADIDISPHRIDFPRVRTHASESRHFTIENNGNEILNINAVSSTSEDFSYDFNQLEIDPGTSEQVTISYSPNTSDWVENITIHSNDSDEPSISIHAFGNYPYGPMPGDPAPNFNLPIVNEFGHNLSLNDLGGSPTVFVFFTAW